MNEHTYEHLEKLRDDVRDEIKKRIEQRDKYSIQLTIVLSAIVALAFSAADREQVLLAAPLASIYFTVLILYSYTIHSVAAKYLTDIVEPKLAEAAGLDRGLEWETYYGQHKVPGIRKRFFLVALWAVTVLSLWYLFAVLGYRPVLIAMSLVYLLACFIVTIYFWEGRCATGRKAPQ